MYVEFYRQALIFLCLVSVFFCVGADTVGCVMLVLILVFIKVGVGVGVRCYVLVLALVLVLLVLVVGVVVGFRTTALTVVE